MVIDHIGIVVKNIAAGLLQWTTLFGYRQITEPVVNTRQKVRVVFLEKDGSVAVKLVEPLDNSSPVWGFARKGGGLHHLCFRTDHLAPELERLTAAGARLLVPPQPGEAFDLENIAFVYAGQGLNIELIDTDKKAEQLNVAENWGAK